MFKDWWCQSVDWLKVFLVSNKGSQNFFCYRITDLTPFPRSSSKSFDGEVKILSVLKLFSLVSEKLIVECVKSLFEGFVCCYTSFFVGDFVFVSH